MMIFLSIISAYYVVFLPQQALRCEKIYHSFVLLAVPVAFPTRPLARLNHETSASPSRVVHAALRGVKQQA